LVEVNGGGDAWEFCALGKLPDDVGGVDRRWRVAIAGYPEWVMGESIVEALIVEMLPCVNDRFLSVNFLEKSGKEVDTISELLGRPILAFLHINHGDEVLLLGVYMTHEVEKLEPHTTRGAHKVVTPHLHATTTRLFEVMSIAGVLIRAALGGFNVNELEVLLACHLFPIYPPLMVRNVNAVAVAHGGGRGAAGGEENEKAERRKEKGEITLWGEASVWEERVR
jgi:hypothetical protein